MSRCTKKNCPMVGVPDDCDLKDCQWRTEAEGAWIREEDYHRCSNCHCVAPLDGEEYWLRGKIREELTEICPNCGARMKGADDD